MPFGGMAVKHNTLHRILCCCSLYKCRKNKEDVMSTSQVDHQQELEEHGIEAVFVSSQPILYHLENSYYKIIKRYDELLIYETPEIIKELIPSEKIALFGNSDLETLKRLCGYSKIKWLIISISSLSELPSDIKQLEKLSFIEIVCDQPLHFPHEITRLSNLTHLLIFNTPFFYFPPETYEIPNLTYLCISNNQIEHFPTEILKLTNLTELVISHNNLSSLPADVRHFKNLTALSLYNNQFSHFPSEITEIPNLKKLDISNNSISNLPDEIDRLNNLTKLDLSGNRLTRLNIKLELLANLTELDISRNQFNHVPLEIANLLNLTKLDLSKNQISNLPVEIGQLANLTELRLSENLLSSLPASMEQLTKLTILYLADNQFSALPNEIVKLINLSELSLSKNQLSDLPLEIRQLINLKELYLYENLFKSIPNAIVNITSLTILNIAKNLLTTLPSEISHLTNLTELYLGENRIKKIPTEVINQLVNLKTLNLSFNRLSAIPSEIKKLTNLSTLSLDGNKIVTLPDEITNLTSLTSLSVSRNMLSTLPTEIGKLTNLVIFDVSVNRLTKIPKGISQLTELAKLDIANNELATIPQEIGELINLIELNLFNNRISNLPSNVFRLRSLTTLNLSSNRLSELSSDICKLTRLISLDLSDNSLTALPDEVCDLDKLETLIIGNYYIRGNKITNLPQEIYKLKVLKYLYLSNLQLAIPPELISESNKPQPVLNYYLSLATKRRTFLNEFKLIIVGEGSVGKTSLIQKIIHGEYDLHKTMSTKGISISQWTLSPTDIGEIQSELSNNQSEVQLNIWDFGGQEIMHATHQFFLTKRSLYLLVLDACKSQEENRVEYWLKIIHSFGGDSPIIIVGNKIDQHPLDLDHSLRKKYPNITDIFETSAVTGKGVEELKNAIIKQIDTIPHVRDQLAENWYSVKSHLKNLSSDNKNYISHDEYLKLCDENNIADDNSQRNLIELMHNLGIVLYFQDDPRLEALGILNPQWVTNGVYKILNSPALYESKGKLTVGMLDDILNSADYPRGKRLFIIDIMKKFELCYDIESDKSFLVPDLLPKNEPKILFKGVPALEYQYPVLPSSVITRFIVRMNQHIHENSVWRSGILLRIGENLALVKADFEDKIISIAIDGLEHTRRDTLAAIRYQLDEIHASIQSLNPQKRVPIPNAPHAEPLEYEYMLMLEREGQDNLLVKDGNRLVKVDIRQLLSGIESEEKRREADGNTTNIYVSGGVSGSNIIVGDENKVTIAKNLFKSIYRAIDESYRRDTEKADLVSDVNEISNEATKRDNANESFLSRRLRNLKKIAPDIAEVALSVLANPTSGFGIVVQKIANKIKDEAK